MKQKLGETHDIGTKDIRSVALVVDTESELLGLVVDVLDGSELSEKDGVSRRVGGEGERVQTNDVDGHSTDRRKERLEVVTGEELGVHSSGVLEEGATKGALGDAETFGDSYKAAGDVVSRLSGIARGYKDHHYSPGRYQTGSRAALETLSSTPASKLE